MFPLFPIVDAVNDTIDGIVTQIRVYFLNQGVKLLGGKRTASFQKENDCLGEEARHRSSARAKSNQVGVEFTKGPLEFLTSLSLS